MITTENYFFRVDAKNSAAAKYYVSSIESGH